MYLRSAIVELRNWAKRPERKPLIIRGARQVGKTTLVNQFSGDFEHYIYLNLELPEDREPFEQFRNLDTLIQAIFFLKNKPLEAKGRTLIFIDEIQEVPEALNILRYFFEEEPLMFVIAAGSMLETLFDKDIHFPVGRVEYKVIRPVSFPEFLGAMNETAALQQLEKIPYDSFAHSKLISLFHAYALIGGMPEVVNHYSQNKDLASLSPIYDSLITSYMDDVEKYASSESQARLIRHAIRATFAEAGKRIKFHGFGKSNYGSREMGEALRILEKAFLIHLIYPQTSGTLPLIPDIRKSPRLQILDSGMLNYFVKIQKEVFGTDDLNKVYQGTLIEHLVGQELLAIQHDTLSNLNFWVREKKTSSAEVDYLFVYDGKLIPVEVKSGGEGKLKSLQLFMDIAPHTMAIRFYAGELSITETQTANGKAFHLLNLPYYLVSQIQKYVEWFEEQIKQKLSGIKD